MKSLLIVGTGGFVGSVARYGVYLLMMKVQTERFYLSTLIVNLLGCLLIGLLSGWLNKLSFPYSLLFITGFCGGFTTFSTFSLDALKLIKEGMHIQLLIYSSTSLVGGVALCMVGFYLVSKG